MKIPELTKKQYALGDFGPSGGGYIRLVDRNTWAEVFIGVTPGWEGPPRPDRQAAIADVRDRLEGRLLR